MKRWIIIVLCAVLILSMIFYFKFLVKISCNDGTIVDRCSKITPYFCSRGKLIEKASVCGCSNKTRAEGDKCISSFQEEPKNISLNYVLRGKKGKIDLVVYKKLADYLSIIPRYMNSNETLTPLDFKLRMLNQEEQREFLLPLVVEIEKITRDKTDQARIAVSLVQNIPFGNSTKTARFGNIPIVYQRYPYEVLYDVEGICSEKSDLMIFLLREIGYGTASFYYSSENHETVGIKCSIKKANIREFCFIETTGPSIIADNQTDYFNIGMLTSSPRIINISEGISLGNDLYEYRDAKILESIRQDTREYGTINLLQYLQYKNLNRKYGLISFNEYSF